MSALQEIPCVILRSGTSKGVYLESRHLPTVKEHWEGIICALFGSPDKRQIDGLGGSDPLTSKVAIIAPPSRADADVDYTFGQVAIKARQVDWRGNCGNISAAVGGFAIEKGYVAARDPYTEVRIHNTNTKKLIIARVPVKNGQVQYVGDYSIDGVPGTGARIELDFFDTGGARSGKILPTGQPIDIMEVASVGRVECSIVDFANPVVFVRAAAFGLSAHETPEEFDANLEIIDRLELVRGAAAVRLGLCARPEEARQVSPARPTLAFITAAGSEERETLFSRLLFMHVMHKAYSVTSSICTGVAITLPGTLPHQLCQHKAKKPIIIGHPAGCIDVTVEAETEKEVTRITKAVVGRTARKLMEGTAYYYLAV